MKTFYFLNLCMLKNFILKNRCLKQEKSYIKTVLSKN
jgi:hypothetical protein